MNNLLLILSVYWIRALQPWWSFLWRKQEIFCWKITLISSWLTSNFGILLQHSGKYLPGHLVGIFSQLSTHCREGMWGMLGFRNPDSISIRQPCHCLHKPKFLPASLSSSKSKAFSSTANNISIWLQASHSGLRTVCN